MRTLYAYFSGKMKEKRPEYHQMCNMHGDKEDNIISKKIALAPHTYDIQKRLIESYKTCNKKVTFSGRFLLCFFDRFFTQTRGKIAKFYQNSLPSPHGMLAFWVVFGYEPTSSDTLIITLRRLGVSDMVVASGYQVSFVYAVALHMFSRKNHRIHTICRMVFLWFYVCIVGFQASILRAALSRTIYEIARVYGRRFQPGWALFLSGAILLCIHPVFLVSQGFQFSFLISAAFLLFSSREEYALSSFFAPIIAWYSILPLEFFYGDHIFLSSIFAELALLWICPTLMVCSVMYLMLAWIPGVQIIVHALVTMCTTVYLEIMHTMLAFTDHFPLEIRPHIVVYTLWIVILCGVVITRFSRGKRGNNAYHI